jgi:hypothetical protein
MMKRRAIDRISQVMLSSLRAAAEGVSLIENTRIGRKNLSYASWKLPRSLRVSFVSCPFHHPRWVGWLYKEYTELYRPTDGLVALTEWEKRTFVALRVEAERICVAGMGPILANKGDGERFRERYGLNEIPLSSSWDKCTNARGSSASPMLRLTFGASLPRHVLSSWAPEPVTYGVCFRAFRRVGSWNSGRWISRRRRTLSRRAICYVSLRRKKALVGSIRRLGHEQAGGRRPDAGRPGSDR